MFRGVEIKATSDPKSLTPERCRMALDCGTILKAENDETGTRESQRCTAKSPAAHI